MPVRGRPAGALFRTAGQPQRNRLVGGAEHSVHAPHPARRTRARVRVLSRGLPSAAIAA